MIIALLRTGEVGYGGAAVLLRATYYVGSLGGAGLAFFSLLFGGRPNSGDPMRLGRWCAGAALLGIVAGGGVLAAQTVELTGGATLLDTTAWKVVLGSRAGVSYGLGGLGLLLVAALRFGRRWAILAAAGGMLVCASYTLLGHSTSLTPRPVLAGLLLVHLVVAAYWIGSLPPLAWAARRSGHDAARLIEDWARIAALIVPVLTVAGVVLAWQILGGLEQLFGSWYGWALLVKVSLVAVMLTFAAWHRYDLTPALTVGVPGAGKRLARSITAEAIVAVLVLYAAAELVSTSPNGFPHRML